MKAEVVTSKRGRKCSYCGKQIEKGIQFVETTDWMPLQKFPDKKNICTECLGERVQFIKTLELLLADLRVMQRAQKELI